MSSTPVEMRVNMSLEDIAKANKANVAKTKAKPTAKGKKTLAEKPKTATGGKSKAKTTVKGQKEAKAVGKVKANRMAQINQKRGLSATNKASPKQIQAMIKNQLTVNKKLAPKKKTNAAPSLKISFDTAKVRQNTDQDMVAQLMGALSKGKDTATKPLVTKPKPKPKAPIIKQPFRK